MSSQQTQVSKVIDTSTVLIDKIEDAFKGPEVDGEMPLLRDAHREFVAALVAYRDTMLHDNLAHAVGVWRLQLIQEFYVEMYSQYFSYSL